MTCARWLVGVSCLSLLIACGDDVEDARDASTGGMDSGMDSGMLDAGPDAHTPDRDAALDGGRDARVDADDREPPVCVDAGHSIICENPDDPCPGPAASLELDVYCDELACPDLETARSQMRRYWCEAHGCGIVALYGNWAYAYYDEATEELIGAASLVDDISIRIDALGGCIVAEANGGRGFGDCEDIEVVCDDDGGF